MRGNAAIQSRPSPSDAARDASLLSLERHRGANFDEPAEPTNTTDPMIAHLRRELDDCRASLALTRAARDRIAEALRHAKSELRLVSAALMSSQEVERKRIAGELHDSIGQAIGTVGFAVGGALDMLRANDSAGAEELLMRAAGHARQAIGEVRRIAMDLRPATLDNLGIVGTMSWFFREFRAVHPDIAVVTDIDVSEARIPAPLTTAIYRVVQEACSNVIRHAQAGAIRVALRYQPGLILLRVEDDGCGIGADKRAGLDCRGLGMRSMRDRVEFSGGSFCIASEPGAGTCVVATWPLSGAFCAAPDAADASRRTVNAAEESS